MRCRALPGGTSTGRPAGDDNPQDRARGGKLSSKKCCRRWPKNGGRFPHPVIQKV